MHHRSTRFLNRGFPESPRGWWAQPSVYNGRGAEDLTGSKICCVKRGTPIFTYILLTPFYSDFFPFFCSRLMGYDQFVCFGASRQKWTNIPHLFLAENGKYLCYQKMSAKILHAGKIIPLLFFENQPFFSPSPQNPTAQKLDVERRERAPRPLSSHQFFPPNRLPLSGVMRTPLNAASQLLHEHVLSRVPSSTTGPRLS